MNGDLMPRVALTATILTFLASWSHAQASDSLIPARLCYQLRYASPQNGARPAAFPRNVVLAPGRDSSDATPETTFVDSVEFGHRRPLLAYWKAKNDSIELVFSNSFSSSIVELPRTLRDSLEGRSVYWSDWWDTRYPGPPRMSALAVRVVVCHDGVAA